MALQDRLNDLITAVGADVKALYARDVFRPTYAFSGSVSLFTGALRWYNDSGRNLTISAVRASVGTAPTGASLIVDVRKNGSTIWPTTPANRPTIAVSTFTQIRSGANLDNTAALTLAPGDFITVDVVQIGSTVPGSDLTVQINLS